MVSSWRTKNEAGNTIAFASLAILIIVAAIASLVIYTNQKNTQDILDAAEKASTTVKDAVKLETSVTQKITSFAQVPLAAQQEVYKVADSTRQACEGQKSSWNAQVGKQIKDQFIELKTTCADKASLYIFKKTDNTWQRVLSSVNGAVPKCSVVDAAKISNQLVPNCLDETGQQIANKNS